MNKEEFRKMLNDNVAYLQRNIPPDDIYLFAECNFMSALYFLNRYSKHVDVNDECQENLTTRKYVVSMLNLMHAREQQLDLPFDLCLDALEDDEDSH